MNAPAKRFSLNHGLQLPMLAAAMSGDYDLIAAEGGWGSGKSFAAVFCIKVLATQYPGTRWGIVSDTGPRLGKVIQPICEQLLQRHGWVWFADHTKRYWESPEGSRIYLVAYNRPDTRADQSNPLEGMDWNGAAVDECQAVKPEVLAKLVGRTRRLGPPGLRNIMIFVGLPMGAQAWWMKAAAGKRGSIAFNASSFVNQKNLSPEFFDKAREHLDPDEYQAMIEGKPAPPKDRVYNRWSEESWPNGNILDGFIYNPLKPTTLAMDFGLRFPAVLMIQSVDRLLPDGRVLTLDVVFDELAPDRILTGGLVETVLDRAWPRAFAMAAPEGVDVLYDGLVVDPAGGATNDQTGLSDIEIIARSPIQDPDGLGRGLGYWPMTEDNPARRHIKTGVQYTKRLICTANGLRRLTCTRELWEWGKTAPMRVRTFARSMLAYQWPSSGFHKQGPRKGGLMQPDHHMDALRYYVINIRPDLEVPRMSDVLMDLQVDNGLPDLLGDR